MAPRKYRIAAIGTAIALTLASMACERTTALSAADRAAIAALDSAYVNAWLEGDTLGVLATLATDAVLMPAGQRALTDRDAIRAFWWPDDGSRMQITAYATTIDEIGGNAQCAFVRGTGRLAFVYEKNGSRTEATSRTMTLTILARQSDGQWRISRRMWGPLAE